ncbi:MAG: hypothetical protein IT385_15325 [Deltaproteobacteria bacterium]|nr:hypothetical protein [Deltaproteobacteria bacterium]
MQLDTLPEISWSVRATHDDEHADAERDLDATFDAIAAPRRGRDEDPMAIARAIRADAESARAPEPDANTNASCDEDAGATSIAALTTALDNGYDYVRDARIGANRRVEILAGDVGEDGLDVDLLTGVLETVFGTVTQELVKAVTAKLGPALLGKMIVRGFEKLIGVASKAAIGAATSALEQVRSKETDRALFFLGVEHGIRAEAFEVAMGALDDLVEGRSELPLEIKEVKERFDDLAADAGRIQDRASRAQWLTYLAQSRLGRMEHDSGVATRDGARGGTALALEASRDAPGVLQVEIEPDLRTIKRAWLPGAGAVQGPDMGTRPISELGIPVRFQIGSLKQAILVNETGRANALGTELRRVLCVLGGGPERASDDDYVWGEGRPFVEAGLRRAVDELMRQKLESRLAAR